MEENGGNFIEIANSFYGIKKSASLVIKSRTNLIKRSLGINKSKIEQLYRNHTTRKKNVLEFYKERVQNSVFADPLPPNFENSMTVLAYNGRHFVDQADFHINGKV